MKRFPQTSCICSIVPPHMLKHIARKGSDAQKNRALQTLITTEQMRGQRNVLQKISFLSPEAHIAKNRLVYDAGDHEVLPGILVRKEAATQSRDLAVNQAYDGAGAFFDFYQKVYGRNSIDNQGLTLRSSVHYSRHYDNAFWNGSEMVYGDGDGDLFRSFTECLDVIGHELTHGVVQYEANLNYQGQAGALNESMADVFGTLLKQYKKKKNVKSADWLIGAGLFTSKVHGKALRSMKAPGTAYDDPVLGKDPQPGHMKNYVETHEDNGGVHLNSGIPNRAFYEAAARIGGYAWEKAGLIWYQALCDKLKKSADFAVAAQATLETARDLYGKNSREQKAVGEAWKTVGVLK